MDLATSQIVSNIIGDVNGVTIAAKYISHSRLDILIYYGKCENVMLLIMDTLNKTDRLETLTQTQLKNMLKNQLNGQIYDLLIETIREIIKKVNNIFIDASLSAHTVRLGQNDIQKLQHYVTIRSQLEKLIKIINKERIDKSDSSILLCVKNALNKGWNTGKIVDNFYSECNLKTDVNKIRQLLNVRTKSYQRESKTQTKTQKSAKNEKITNNKKTETKMTTPDVSTNKQKTQTNKNTTKKKDYKPIWKRLQQPKMLSTWEGPEGELLITGTHIKHVPGKCNNFQVWNDCVLRNLLKCKDDHTCSLCGVQYHGANRCPKNPHKIDDDE